MVGPHSDSSSGGKSGGKQGERSKRKITRPSIFEGKKNNQLSSHNLFYILSRVLKLVRKFCVCVTVCFRVAFRMCKLKALVIPRPSFWSVKMEGVGQVISYYL